ERGRDRPGGPPPRPASVEVGGGWVVHRVQLDATRPRRGEVVPTVAAQGDPPAVLAEIAVLADRISTLTSTATCVHSA
ncbi:MAG: hypothetical protein LC721_04735, partial [Actinobacteria bacterium]|nr:hypothetical protein [Actinomycetota bacterium]